MAVLATAACGGTGGGDASAPDAGPVHVHGLGLDPSDGALYIATHTGLYRLAADAAVAKRVGDRRQDTMSFVVAGPGRFLASGHPDVREAVEHDLPSHLGLIESTDGGASWDSLGLEGEADFHLLRVAGDRVYGIDAIEGRLLVTDDNGVSWDERALPAGLVDLVPAPGSNAELLAATQQGFAATDDNGKSWELWDGDPGLLAWPVHDRLFVFRPDGQVFGSRDSGRTWTVLGGLEAEPAAVIAANGDVLYAALHDGTVMVSRDNGATWQVRATAPAEGDSDGS